MKIHVLDYGLCDYQVVWQAMQAHTASRGKRDCDELWLVQHPAVFTLGRAGRREHVLDPGTIPVLETDRGGQVTYHGPGQLVAYTLIDVNRLGIGPRELVRRIEQGIIEFLALYSIDAERRAGAPGVYVADAKIAALGLRIRRGYSYHGVALNVAMDLEPFKRINPCGYAGLEVTESAAHGGPSDCTRIGSDLALSLCYCLFPDVPLDIVFKRACEHAPSQASIAAKDL